VAEAAGSGAGSTATATAPARPRSEIRAAEEIDLLATVGVPPVVKYAAVAVGGFLLGLLVAWLWNQ
jgi:hypothetical protein